MKLLLVYCQDCGAEHLRISGGKYCCPDCKCEQYGIIDEEIIEDERD